MGTRCGLATGRLQKLRGPGLTFIIPVIDRFYRVDLRVITLDVTQQRIITRNNVSVEVDAVVFYQINDSAKSVVAVEVRDVRLPESMQRAMARQAEAEREKRARVWLAEGEFLAAEQLTSVGANISQQPVALELRYLETLTEIAVEKNSTILFPMRIDILQG
ncbi:Protein QmcA [Thermoflexales bacterium]|nr:Protein QmcA [Thermoflexales bacterium]